jgi:hypothetical protein
MSGAIWGGTSSCISCTSPFAPQTQVNHLKTVCTSLTADGSCIADRIAEVERGHRQHISNDEGMLSQSQCIEELLVLLHTGGGTEAAFRQALTACRKGRVP